MTVLSRVSPANEFEERLKDVDDFDLAITALLLTSVQSELANLNQLNKDCIAAVKRAETNRRYYRNSSRNRRRTRDRRQQVQWVDTVATDTPDTPDNANSHTKTKFTSWEVIRDSISERLFRRKYRMSKYEFALLCDKIRNKIGDDVFRTENTQALCGYTKVAIGLRMLCGGSYLDLIGRAYDVQSINSVFKYFHTFINWINTTFDYPWVSLLHQLKDGNLDALGKLKEISEYFAIDSDGAFSGCIGAIDGIAIRIRCPTKKDGVHDPGNYFCRKNFYALNVQAICDRQKRILWISPNHKGSTHDSTAWQETRLHDLLSDMNDILKEHGLFIVGDSAYPLSAYLQVPYHQPSPNSQEDAFNFWLSNSRIQIECAFGEFIARFGLFWRTLKFSLSKCNDIIYAASKVHNFLIDCREDTAEEDDNYVRTLSHTDVAAVDSSIGDDDEDDMTYPLVSDNNEPKPPGRPTNEYLKKQEEGEELRSYLCTTLYSEGCVRLTKKNMKYNKLGHAYFE